MMFPVEIEQNLHLAFLQEPHAEISLNLVNANREYLRQWLPWVDNTRRVEDMKHFINSAMDQFSKGLGFHTGIFSESNLIGICGYKPINKTNRIGEIGYWLDSKHQGKGIMTKCILKMVDLGFEKLDLNRIEIRCAVGNSPSCAIPERLGFTREGVLREAEWLYDHFVDHIVYSKLASEHRSVHGTALSQSL